MKFKIKTLSFLSRFKKRLNFVFFLSNRLYRKPPIDAAVARERSEFPIIYIRLFFYPFVTYIVSVQVGKGLPTYCVTRTVGRQPLAASDKKSNQWALKMLYMKKIIDT